MWTYDTNMIKIMNNKWTNFKDVEKKRIFD